tara:strand:+ start:2432 stop:2851 length:420 start_codon:yes stop_codon:yes gene_type:complete
MASIREINENNDIFVGVTLPLKPGITGHFQQSKTLREQAYSNLKNLILTAKGERLGQPTFGCDVQTIIFEPITENTADSIEESVRDAVSNWLPYITIQNVFVTFEGQDNNRIRLQIEYSVTIDEPDSLDTITFNFNVGI